MAINPKTQIKIDAGARFKVVLNVIQRGNVVSSIVAV